MKKLLGFFFLLISSYSFAGAVSLTYGGGYSASKTISGASAVAANGAFSAPAVVNVAGKSITVPATARFAANAASFAVTKGRGNPAGMGAALTAYFALEGLSWAVDHWNKSTTIGGTDSTGAVPYNGYCWSGYSGGCAVQYGIGPDGPTAALNKQCKLYNPPATVQSTSYATDKLSMSYTCSNGAGGWVYRTSSCYSGYTLSNGVCSGTSVAPAAEQDFTNLQARPVTDAAAQELARAGEQFPVDSPLWPQQDIALGDARMDPISGRMVQDRVRINQSDPVGNPTAAMVTPYTVDAGAVTGQTANPVAATKELAEKATTGNEAATPSQTQCDKYPNSFGCQDVGTVDDSVNLQTQNRTFSITPVSIGGSGACPADKVMHTRHGDFTFKYGPICDATAWLKPLVLAMAWFVAALIIVGSVRGEE